MFNKRIAAALAGTALAASAIIVPQVSALEGYVSYNGVYGKIEQRLVTQTNGDTAGALENVFEPSRFCCHH